jgi:hypothetical protein
MDRNTCVFIGLSFAKNILGQEVNKKMRPSRFYGTNAMSVVPPNLSCA